MFIPDEVLEAIVCLIWSLNWRKGSLSYPRDLSLVRLRKSASKLTFSRVSLRVLRDFPYLGNDSMRVELMVARGLGGKLEVNLKHRKSIFVGQMN